MLRKEIAAWEMVLNSANGRNAVVGDFRASLVVRDIRRRTACSSLKAEEGQDTLCPHARRTGGRNPKIPSGHRGRQNLAIRTRGYERTAASGGKLRRFAYTSKNSGFPLPRSAAHLRILVHDEGWRSLRTSEGPRALEHLR